MAPDLLTVARDVLDADRDVTWTIGDEVLLVTLRTDEARRFRLDLGSDAFPLDLGDRYSLPEHEYDEADQPGVVVTQVRRGLAYLHGLGDEATTTRGRTEISWTLTLPDGSVVRAWRTPLQRLRHRLTGRSRLVQTGHVPGVVLDRDGGVP